ncbi:hypothetical protein HDU79_001722 [Rhizoclosmatium sp. JEL0117]|nr:hypothetical protein HDU79_001722 [Rhizoclosmatium sp. JEL0117]
MLRHQPSTSATNSPRTTHRFEGDHVPSIREDLAARLRAVTIKLNPTQLRLAAIYAVTLLLILSSIFMASTVMSKPSSPRNSHGSSDREAAIARENIKLLYTASTGIGLTNMLFAANAKAVAAGTHKRVLVAFNFVGEELKTMGQRHLMRLAYKNGTDDADVLFVVRDPKNNVEDRILTTEQTNHHDLFSLGQTYYERFHEHGEGKSGLLFPQTVVKHLGRELPHYDFIVLTDINTIINLENLVSQLENWDSSSPVYGIHEKSGTAILSTNLTTSLPYPLGLADQKLANVAKKVLDAKIKSLDNNLVESCDRMDGPQTAIIIQGCDSFTKKYNAFKAIQYIDTKVEFSADKVNKFLPQPPLAPKSILFGVFSYFNDIPTLRRHILRFGYSTIQRASQRSIDLRFIMAVPGNEYEKFLILEEQARYGDILLIDTPESMNDGKSYRYVEQVWQHMVNGSLPQYDFIFKVDEDAYMNLRGIAANLAEYDPQESLYFGRGLLPEKKFFFGMIYGFSNELAKRIAALNPKPDEIKGPEDQMMGDIVDKANNETEKITWNLLDLPDVSTAFSLPRTKESMGMHRLKDYVDIWNEIVHYEILYSL